MLRLWVKSWCVEGVLDTLAICGNYNAIVGSPVRILPNGFWESTRWFFCVEGFVTIIS